jgi:L-iditol 2-dehydrogenase
VPDAVSDIAAALFEPLPVALWACWCWKGQVSVGDDVLVTGDGPVGIAVLQVARASGVTDVTVWDVNADRRTAAVELGATLTVDPSKGAAEGHAGPLRPRVLRECSAHAGTTRATLFPAAGRAVLVWMGGGELTLPLSLLQERELVIQGDLPVCQHVASRHRPGSHGRGRPRRLVTGHFTLSETDSALMAARWDSRAIKSVIPSPRTEDRSDIHPHLERHREQ